MVLGVGVDGSLELKIELHAPLLVLVDLASYARLGALHFTL